MSTDKLVLNAKKMYWDVSVTLDAKDWALYTSADPLACEEAAKAINQGIKALAAAGCQSWADYSALLRPFASLGATDTEPLCAMQDVLVGLGIMEDDL